MCEIFGYIGQRDAVPLVLAGLPYRAFCAFLVLAIIILPWLFPSLRG